MKDQIFRFPCHTRYYSTVDHADPKTWVFHITLRVISGARPVQLLSENSAVCLDHT